MPDPLTLRADSVLIPAPGWWIVRRLPDASWPIVWERRTVAAFTLGRGRDGVELVAVLGDGAVHPCRRAEVGRDGHDYHVREDELEVCECTEPHPCPWDESWCGYCARLFLGDTGQELAAVVALHPFSPGEPA